MIGRSLLLTSVLLAHNALGFNARSVAKPFKTTTTTTELKSTLSSMSEQEAAYLMAKARECAFSDTCSIEESREHLHDVLNIQVACASGAVVGQDVCEDQQEVAEIVSHLRQNIDTHDHGLSPRQQALAFGGLLPLAFLALTCFSMLLANANPNVTPFTFQEVVWATRDGYMDDLVHHFLQNGGLLVGAEDTPTAAADAAVPFTFQEVVWAAKGGYLDDMFHHYMRNGGL